MTDRHTLDRASYIFTTGKKLHDYVFRIYARRLADKGKRPGSDELSINQLHAVMETRKKGPLTITQLADVLGVSAPSASAMVDRLVERGYLTRQIHPRDRRKVQIGVSEQAEQQIVRVENQILNSFVDIVDKIGPEVAQKWCDVLDVVSRTLSERDSGQDHENSKSHPAASIEPSA
jgi:DNA-binding MarR family transcriptional regulator